MSTKLALQKILKGIIHTEAEKKQPQAWEVRKKLKREIDEPCKESSNHDGLSKPAKPEDGQCQKSRSINTKFNLNKKQ
jgi:hypothetical protein